MSDGRRCAALERLFPGEGEMAHRLRDFDWRGSPLGSPLDWPQSVAPQSTSAHVARWPVPGAKCGQKATLPPAFRDWRRARGAFDSHLVKPAELDALRRVLAEVRPENLH